MAEPTNAGPVGDFQRVDDFNSYYANNIANNIQLEWSQFDLKLIFGQLDQSAGKVRVEQHSAVTRSLGSSKTCPVLSSTTGCSL
jgi:hypothetical protein